MKKKRSRVSGYNKWGYIFLIPFTLAYVIFQLIPLVNTIYNSFFENYMSGLTQIGPTFVGLDNYVKLFEGGRDLDICKKYDGPVDHVFYSADHPVAFTGGMVFGYASET